MLGLILRVLPFWVREPLLIVFGVVFAGFLFYVAAAREGGWAAVGIGAGVVLFTAVRIHTVRQAWQARRLLKEAGEAAP
ncbi:hypothetical protein [Streptomyces sp. NBC_00582]|uniref:hypothetical protein n=1 Tax=Streptomyces sp. NBC_00582 TaxID=2975783 RepID=UPI002E80961E|nr:hypothetical protein [Streptomyces sp. NBC_00582]WUB62647.1 hypothetical protein OG852_20705 [Streptomyces sp. NBC_00582]